MFKAKNVASRSVSEKQLAANRRNAQRSTGPRTLEGKKNASMNNCKHGMFSTKEVLPCESQAEYDERKAALTAVLKPRDAVEEILVDHVFTSDWLVRRGRRAANARAARAVNRVVEGADRIAAKKVERLAAKIDQGPDAVRRLREFPAGVAYLRHQWWFLHELLANGMGLLATQRCRCLSLLGKTREDVLRDDMDAARWVCCQLGMMYGAEVTPAQVAEFLGSQTRTWISEAEFSIRVERISDAVPPKEEAVELMLGFIAEILDELESQTEIVEDTAERDLAILAEGAPGDVTVEGQRLSNHIQANARGFLAALRRLEIRQQPERPGPKRGPRQPQPPADAIDDLVARPQASPDANEPMEVPTLVAAPVDATVVTEPPAETGADISRDEPILDPTPGADPDISRDEPISDATTGTESDISRDEPILDDLAADDFLNRPGPAATCLDRLSQILDANDDLAGLLGALSARPAPAARSSSAAELKWWEDDPDRAGATLEANHPDDPLPATEQSLNEEQP
jgi:hypothetical protein